MEQTENPVKLMPIVNGSFNHELTNEQMLEFDYETKKAMAWRLIVAMDFPSSFRDIDPKVFTPTIPKVTHDMLTPDRIDDMLVTARTEFQQRHKQLLTLTENYYYKLGQRIHEARKELGFGGFIEMDYRKMIGYIVAGGSWNNFKHFEVSGAVKELEFLTPKFYMPNNPNNGSKNHVWKTSGEYLVIHCKYLSAKDLILWDSFYSTHFERIGRQINADSVRKEVADLGQDYYALDLIMWWD